MAKAKSWEIRERLIIRVDLTNREISSNERTRRRLNTAAAAVGTAEYAIGVGGSLVMGDVSLTPRRAVKSAFTTHQRDYTSEARIVVSSTDSDDDFQCHNLTVYI